MKRACEIVSKLARKYDCNPAWLWDLLDNHFNMRKGEAAMLDCEDIEAFKEIIEEYLDE